MSSMTVKLEMEFETSKNVNACVRMLVHVDDLSIELMFEFARTLMKFNEL